MAEGEVRKSKIVKGINKKYVNPHNRWENMDIFVSHEEEIEWTKENRESKLAGVTGDLLKDFEITKNTIFKTMKWNPEDVQEITADDPNLPQ